MSSVTPAKNQDDICQRCLYTRWAHEAAPGVLPDLCNNFEEPHSEDPLQREPDYDFAEFRAYCETNNVDMAHVDIEFIFWLHAQAHGHSLSRPQAQP